VFGLFRRQNVRLKSKPGRKPLYLHRLCGANADHDIVLNFWPENRYPTKFFVNLPEMPIKDSASSGKKLRKVVFVFASRSGPARGGLNFYD
jgi:hypothetical protein